LYDTEWYNCLKGATLENNKIFCWNGWNLNNG
jgi:hypothetical protein